MSSRTPSVVHAITVHRGSRRGLVFSSLVFSSLVLCVVGCGGPGRVTPPEIDPAAAAAQALSRYDSNQDAQLDEAELKKSPGLQQGKSRYDTNNDGKLSAAEIESRIASWSTQQIAITSLSCTFIYKGAPLVGADVLMEPEPYLGDQVKPAKGHTSQDGSAIMAIDDSDLPKAHKGIRGVHYGTYKVRVTHPSINLPAKYNTETVLGHEVADDYGKPYATFQLN
ncbi:MAG: hypothetical protein R3E01_12145 [Pirellulaceae bacterium]|nr:hypothetical protein [Planctomycetales bacterium]